MITLKTVQNTLPFMFLMNLEAIEIDRQLVVMYS